jgi:hypothetical protein
MMCWQLSPPSCAMSTQRVGDHHGCHKISGDRSRWDATLRRTDKWRLGSRPERTSSKDPNASWRPEAATSRFGPGTGTSRDGWRHSLGLGLKAMTSEPDERSWDFDESVSTSVRNRTRRSPMLTHETSPVSGASVMGMTTRVGQGQSHLPADVPGISMALGQRGQLHLNGWLCQQPAGDFTEEIPSQRRRRNSSNGHFAKSGMAPTRSTEVGDKRDASHARP